MKIAGEGAFSKKKRRGIQEKNELNDGRGKGQGKKYIYL